MFGDFPPGHHEGSLESLLIELKSRCIDRNPKIYGIGHGSFSFSSWHSRMTKRFLPAISRMRRIRKISMRML
ncbi:hypothetical protein GMO_11530 [Gluconobacter morbifer G707]|uniref:Uncharacterized protein n=1 Tax=Gluconobacter morbifer G707 TaxID=1088869 RepID=G6XIS5_9PROT|nr:hypothetical protein GMO_11530 [Gluconobacter morbifer G707]